MADLTRLEARAVEVTGRYALDVINARAAMEAAPEKFGPESEEFYAARRRWVSRPHGRSAPPGDLEGVAQEPRDYRYGGDIRCRRCHAVASLEGHPYGCPQTPQEHLSRLRPMRLCYCGQTMVAAPEIFGPCCENTPPVRVPGGCRWCGSDLCRVGDPDDLPEHTYYIEARFPDMGDAWVHPRCIDAKDLERAPADRLAGGVAQVEERRRKRRLPLGVVDA
jgi:hypothetical protein